MDGRAELADGSKGGWRGRLPMCLFACAFVYNLFICLFFSVAICLSIGLHIYLFTSAPTVFFKQFVQSNHLCSISIFCLSRRLACKLDLGLLESNEFGAGWT